jgi:hypothetical protein
MPRRCDRHCARVSTESPVMLATSSVVSKRADGPTAAGIFMSFVAVGISSLFRNRVIPEHRKRSFRTTSFHAFARLLRVPEILAHLVPEILSDLVPTGTN